MSRSVKIPGSCGELVQGRMNGINFHATCPVKIFSQVSVSLIEGCGRMDFPPERVKSAKAVEKTLTLLNGKGRAIKLRINSQIPMSKGMASSTADITGSCQAVASLLGKRVTPSQIAHIAAEIEPTDGIMYEGVVCFDHTTGTLLENLGYPPPMKLLIVDPGGTVDTTAFNRRKDLDILRRANEEVVQEAYFLVKEGIKKRNTELIGMGATISSICNQTILYKPQLKMVISLSKKVGALGVCVAHSGTVMGILLPPDFSAMDTLEEHIKRACGYDLRFYRTETTKGELIDKKGPI